MPNLVGLPSHIFLDSICVSVCPPKNSPLFYGRGLYFAYDSEPCIFFKSIFIVISRYCLPNNEKAREDFFKSNGAEKLGQYLADLYISRRVFMITAGIGLGIVLLYMICVKFFPKTLFWITFMGFIALFIVLGYFFYQKGENTQDFNDKINYKIIALILWFLDSIFILGICLLYDDIQSAFSIIEATTCFIFSNPMILLTPFINFLVMAVFIGFWIITVIFLYSVGKIIQYNGTPFSNVEWEDSVRNLWYYYLFGLFWGVTFIIANLQFVISATAVQWYFSGNSDENGSGSIWRSYWWSLRYHIGSIAFGGPILALTNFIQLLCEFMKVFFLN